MRRKRRFNFPPPGNQKDIVSNETSQQFHTAEEMPHPEHVLAIE
jgi:hypothetical protein